MGFMMKTTKMHFGRMNGRNKIDTGIWSSAAIIVENNSVVVYTPCFYKKLPDYLSKKNRKLNVRNFFFCFSLKMSPGFLIN